MLSMAKGRFTHSCHPSHKQQYLSTSSYLQVNIRYQYQVLLIPIETPYPAQKVPVMLSSVLYGGIARLAPLFGQSTMWEVACA